MADSTVEHHLLQELTEVIRKRIWYSALFFILVVTSVAIWTYRQKEIYEAKATIIIDIQPPRVLAIREVVELGAGSFWSNKEYYETQYKIISSRKIAKLAVERLGLSKDVRFLGLEGVKGEELERRLADVDPVQVLRDCLSVEPVHESRVVKVIARHHYPDLARAIANTVAEVYRDQNLAYRSVATENAAGDLSRQFLELKQKLEAAEERFAKFRNENGIIMPGIDEQVAIKTDEIQYISKTLHEITTDLEKLSARLTSIGSHDDIDTLMGLNEVLQNPLIAKYKESLVDLQTEKIRLGLTFLDRHPKIQAVERQIDTLNKIMAKEVRAIVGALERQRRALEETRRRLVARLNAAKAEAKRLDGLRLDYEKLRREVEENRSLYDMVVKRLRETSLSSEIQTNNVRILDRALLPKFPVKPRRALNLTLGLLFGLLGGIMFGFVVDYFDQNIYTREDIEKLGVPFLGIAPEVAQVDDKAEDADLYILEHPKSAAAEAARVVHTNLVFSKPEGEVRRIVVSSASPREGKTHTAINIAFTMAMSGRRTLLVDSDMRRPRIHGVFGVSRRNGLSNLIIGKTDFDSAIVPTKVENLDFLPCGPIPPNPAELLQTEGFVGLLDRLGEIYDCVVLDSPPILAVADPLIIGQLSDGVLLVISAGSTSREMAFRSIQAIRDVNAPILGAVLNKVDLERGRGRGYYYYRSGYRGYYYSASETTEGEA